MGAVSKEYEDVILLAVTPKKQCVGIKVFYESNLPDMNDNVVEDFHAYIDQCFQSAINLKTSIETGIFDMNDPKIVQYPRTNMVDIQHIIDENTKKITQLHELTQENLFIDLGRSMLDSVRFGRTPNDVVCTICLNEIRVMSKSTLTPLMLKKNPQIVHWVWKLCHYSEHDGQEVSSKSRTIREAAIGTLGGLKMVLKFNDCDEQFINWFFESAKLFQELTRHLSHEQRTQLTIDPEIELLNQSIV